MPAAGMPDAAEHTGAELHSWAPATAPQTPRIGMQRLYLLGWRPGDYPSSALPSWMRQPSSGAEGMSLSGHMIPSIRKGDLASPGTHPSLPRIRRRFLHESRAGLANMLHEVWKTENARFPSWRFVAVLRCSPHWPMQVGERSGSSHMTIRMHSFWMRMHSYLRPGGQELVIPAYAIGNKHHGAPRHAAMSWACRV
jgi:hypothetical protein